MLQHISCANVYDVYDTKIYRKLLGWNIKQYSRKHNRYYDSIFSSFSIGDNINIFSDKIYIYNNTHIKFVGHVKFKQYNHIIYSDIADIYLTNKLNSIQSIELLGNIYYIEPNHIFFAKRIYINFCKQYEIIQNILYRIDYKKFGTMYSSWGEIKIIKICLNHNIILKGITYSNCPRINPDWKITSKYVILNNANKLGIARHIKFFISKYPILYFPYFQFSISKNNVFTILCPVFSFSKANGWSYIQPYKIHFSPNIDMIILSKIFSKRGLIINGKIKYLNKNYFGVISGYILPKDNFLKKLYIHNDIYFNNEKRSLFNWKIHINHTTILQSNFNFNINFNNVSHNYSYGDINENFTIFPEINLLQQAHIIYAKNNWFIKIMLQNYKIIHDLNILPRSFSKNFGRLPQIYINGTNIRLFYGYFTVIAQIDRFVFANNVCNINYNDSNVRYHFNFSIRFPISKFPIYIIPNFGIISNQYSNLHKKYLFNNNIIKYNVNKFYGIYIPKYSIEGGIRFIQHFNCFRKSIISLIEPKFYYLYIPYFDQTYIPNYESYYFIFNVDQLFRDNYFSGIDRIGNANQISYSITSNVFSNSTEKEKFTFIIGQIYYFSNERVSLYNDIVHSNIYKNNFSTNKFSPIALRINYYINPFLYCTGDYIVNTNKKINNIQFNLSYQRSLNNIISIGYSYISKDTDYFKKLNIPIQNKKLNFLNQLIFNYNVPITKKLISLGSCYYNFGMHKNLISVLGLQYNSCCWKIRIIGERKIRDIINTKKKYSNNIYFQISLNGINSIDNNNISNFIRSYAINNDMFSKK